MSGKAIAIVGMRGMGKSTIVKKTIEPVHKDARIVYDINGEYKDLYPYPLLSFEDFETKIRSVKNAVIVVEEATVFLNNRSFSFDFLDTIVRARHANNTIILVFHSLRAVPKYIFELLNYVIILKTQDKTKDVEKFDNYQLTKAFIEIKTAALLKGENGKLYSPNKIVDLFDTSEPETEDNDKEDNKA